MTRFQAAFFILATIAASLVAPIAQAQEIRVIDGDTIAIDDTRFRIWGIAAPDKPKDAKERATAIMRELVTRGPVACNSTGKTSYNRIVAVCTNAAGDLAAQMVTSGFALDWPSYSKRAYAAAELEARSASRGLWALGYKPTSNPNHLTK